VNSTRDTSPLGKIPCSQCGGSGKCFECNASGVNTPQESDEMPQLLPATTVCSNCAEQEGRSRIARSSGSGAK